MKYVIDSCSLINARSEYNMQKSTFLPIWNKLKEMVDNGTLISTEEVLEELKDEDLLSWAKVNNQMFYKTDQSVQNKVAEILKIFPNLIKLKSVANSNADPFLIAVAILLDDTVIVTDERLGDENNDPHIPNVCIKYGIKYMNLHEFVNSLVE